MDPTKIGDLINRLRNLSAPALSLFHTLVTSKMLAIISPALEADAEMIENVLELMHAFPPEPASAPAA